MANGGRRFGRRRFGRPRPAHSAKSTPPEATAALNEAAEQGSRGVRNAARQQLARRRHRSRRAARGDLSDRPQPACPAGRRVAPALCLGASRRAALRPEPSAGRAQHARVFRDHRPGHRPAAVAHARRGRRRVRRRRRASAPLERDDGRPDATAAAAGRRADRDRPRRDRRRDRHAGGGVRGRRWPPGVARRIPVDAAAAPHPGGPYPGRAARGHVACRHRGYPRDLQRGLDHRRTAVAAVDGRGPARSRCGARHGRHARSGRRAESHRACRPHRAQELRQLHVHAHGERLDPHDGAGAGARNRRHAAARVRHRRPDARHRQGAHSDRGPQQTGETHRRRVRDHEAARHRWGGDSAPDA